ncbi:MAG TPA: acylphosphatase [Verrucomicrobiota bacterium]|nr:acylphosphatase [Verrucomicrobiota bacterium]HRZ37007.1 acylphosphatase [Candidatus Paceibacterota bacterium]HRZ54373.1 acylphosphatase [Candidatus Paceibacterota bacterium]
MNRCRLHIWYSGHVQGVGFRYSVRSVAQGYEVAGLVRNLLDGRVELVAEGTRDELDAFRLGILDSGLSGLIRNEEVVWERAEENLRGFVISNE